MSLLSDACECELALETTGFGLPVGPRLSEFGLCLDVVEYYVGYVWGDWTVGGGDEECGMAALEVPVGLPAVP